MSTTDATLPESFETSLTIGPSAIDAYSRLSYTMWYALAEFVDNSTQSRLNYGNLIDDVLRAEGKTLEVSIIHDPTFKELRVEDNSIGMTKERLIEALKIANPTKDSKGRSRYGMGMKTAACWLGRKWSISTVEWDSGIEWTAEVDVDAIAHQGAKVSMTPKAVGKNEHYTKIRIEKLRRRIQKRTEETIREFLGSMYMFDLQPASPDQLPLILTFNGTPIPPATETEWDTDLSGQKWYKKIGPTLIGGKSIEGWVGVLKKGGRKFGGFSLFQNGRQIRGFPAAWKPVEIYGGVDDEGANNLIAQRLTGVLLLDPQFAVSHTKDAILFEDDEEDEVIKFLEKETRDFRKYANIRRSNTRPTALSKEKIRDIVQSLTSEFTSGEMKDAVNTASLPPIEAIVATNKQRVESLTPADHVATLPITDKLKIIVSLQDRSEYDPYLTMSPAATAGEVHVIINALHPYYQSLEQCAAEECLHQYIYDAVAEYRAHQLTSRIVPDTVRRLKDSLLKVPIHQNENANYDVQFKNTQALYDETSSQ
jgi:hypothetical protein